MAQEKASKATTIKKKIWVQLVAPQSFNSQLIGEIPTTETKKLIGRVVTVNLMSLTGDMKKQNTNIKFLISQIKGDNAVTELHGYSLNSASVKRLVRRKNERIGLSFICKTADKKTVRIKPLMITRDKVKGSVSSSLQKTVIPFVTSHVEKTTFDNMIRELINKTLQKALKDAIKKIYPVKVVEISYLQIENKKGEQPQEMKVVEEKPKEEIKEEAEETTQEEPEEDKK